MGALNTDTGASWLVRIHIIDTILIGVLQDITNLIAVSSVPVNPTIFIYYQTFIYLYILIL